MVAVPAAKPVTAPVLTFTVATAVLLLLHEPPVTVDENDAEAPTHRFWLPLSTPETGGDTTPTTKVDVATPQGNPGFTE
jgi:hypothetical protein